MTEKTFSTRDRSRQKLATSIRLVVAAGLAVVSAIVMLAPTFGAVRWAPLAVVVSARHIIAPVLLLGAALWLVCAIMRRATRGERVLAGVAVVALVASVAALTVGSGTVPPGDLTPKSSGDVRVLIWNTNQDAVDAQTVVALVESTKPDVVVLPEYFGQIAGNLTTESAVENYDLYWSENSSASILVNQTLGEYRVDPDAAPAWAGIEATPVDKASQSPKLVIAHLQHAGIFSTALWNEHLDWVAAAGTGGNVIAAGDLNTSAENLTSGTLGDCHDAAVQLGRTSTATWPAKLPAQFGIQIDRVMSSSQWHAVSYQVIGTEDGAGSDHRPVVVDLSRAGS